MTNDQPDDLDLDILDSHISLMKLFPIKIRISIFDLFGSRKNEFVCPGARTLRKALDKQGITYHSAYWGTDFGYFEKMVNGKLVKYAVGSLGKNKKPINMAEQYLPRTIILNYIGCGN